MCFIQGHSFCSVPSVCWTCCNYDTCLQCFQCTGPTMIMTRVHFWTHVIIAASPISQDTRQKPHPSYSMLDPQNFNLIKFSFYCESYQLFCINLNSNMGNLNRDIQSVDQKPCSLTGRHIMFPMKIFKIQISYLPSFQFLIIELKKKKKVYIRFALLTSYKVVEILIKPLGCNQFLRFTWQLASFFFL